MGRRRTTQRKGNAEVGGGRIMGEYIKRQDAIDAALYKSYPGEIESALKNIPAINVIQKYARNVNVN